MRRVFTLLWTLHGTLFGAGAARAESPAPPPLPELLPMTPWSPPPPVVRTLANGTPVFVVARPGIGTFEVRYVVRAGEPLDPTGQEGLAAVTLDLVDDGAAGKDAAAFSAAIRALGAEVASYVDGDHATVGIRGLSRNVEPALALWTDAIRAPTFAPGDVGLAVQKRTDRVALAVRQPAGAADRVQAAVQYGASYLGRSPTAASLASIDAAAVSGFWKRYGVPANAAVVAGGDVDIDRLVALLDAGIGALPAGERTTLPAAAINAGGGLTVADVPGAPQVALRAFAPIGPPADPGRAALTVGMEAVGGAFTSRINLDLREAKGWTYGARCAIVDRNDHGYVTCGALVRADVAGPALAALKGHLTSVVAEHPLAGDEVVRFRDSVLRAYAVDHTTLGSVLDAVATNWLLGSPPDEASRWLRDLGAVTLGTADAAVRGALVPERITCVAAGDLAVVRADLEALGMPVTERAP